MSLSISGLEPAMPLRSRKSGHTTPQFMVINKNVTSALATVDDGQLKQSKQRHMQRQHPVKKRHSRLDSFRSPPLRSKVLHVSGQGASEELDEEPRYEPRATNSRVSPFSSRQFSSSAESQASGAKCHLPKLPANALPSHRGRPNSTGSCQHYLANNEVPRPREGYALDPFSTTTLKHHPAAPSLVHYYTHAVVPRVFSVDARATKISGSRHLHAFQKDMQCCMTDETQMYALLASSLVHRNRFDTHLQIPGIKAKDEQRALLYFKTQAMAAVRRKLADGVLDPGLVQVVYRLQAIETCLRNRAAATAHSKALSAIITALGGVQSLDLYNKERVIHSDLYEAAQSLRRPDLPLTWDPGQLSVETMQKIAASGSLDAPGSAFFDPQFSKHFHLDMLDLFSALTTVIELTVYSWTPMADLTTEDVSWQILRRAAIEHRLFSFPSTHSCAGEHNFIQECTRLATLFWMAMYLGYSARSGLLAPYKSLLRKTLERSGLQCLWYPHSPLLLWILATGAFMAKKGDEYDWFADMAAKVATYLQLKTVADVQRILQGFFYIDDIQHKVLAKLVDDFQEYPQLASTEMRYHDLNTSPQESSLRPGRDIL